MEKQISEEKEKLRALQTARVELQKAETASNASYGFSGLTMETDEQRLDQEDVDDVSKADEAAKEDEKE